MEIIQIELKNKNAMAILKGMERAQIIRLLDKRKSRSKNDVISFKGVFSKARAIELVGNIEKSKEEWDSRTT